ncbi:MAG: DUF6077 domain-containing protein [Acetatifactor sp.]
MKKDYSAADLIPATAVAFIGIAEVSHLCGVFLNRPFHFCALLFGALAVPVILLAAALALVMFRKHRKEVENTGKPASGTEKLLLVLFAAVVLSQLFFVLTNRDVYRRGDMTVETVGSFLQSNAVYQVNPMTGLAYEQGIPSRLKILCLPTLYGALCELLRLSPQSLVWKVSPVLTLLGCYGAYGALAGCLFGEDRKKRRTFLIAVALLLWAGSYLYGMDGFGILYCGWRGVTIRNTVLIPWVVSLCLRRKWLPALACVMAEACLVWTLYGMGACLFVLAGMAVVGVFCKKADAGQAGGREVVR